jgi:carbonic anhydrase/acetyltransferase-like protein (isoleucine patch superfamily)
MDSRTYDFEGTEPDIDADANVSREAVVAGDVVIGADTTVWPGVVLRGDVDPIRIGESSAIGDNAVLHGATVGDHTLLGHGIVLNEADVGDNVLVGANATLSNATVGDGSIVSMGSVVPEDYDVPPASFVRGTPAEVTPLAETDIDREAVFERYGEHRYGGLAAGHGALFD